MATKPKVSGAGAQVESGAELTPQQPVAELGVPDPDHVERRLLVMGQIAMHMQTLASDPGPGRAALINDALVGLRAEASRFSLDVIAATGGPAEE